MGERLILGTRKGVFIFEQRGGAWKPGATAHLGARVSYAACDPRSGSLWACLDHGHWGPKLSRSGDGGESFEEMPSPRYPDGAEIKPGEPAALGYIWVLQPGLAAQPDVLYLGTEPGGLFKSTDAGETWQLVEGLWNHPSRPGGWFGGGRDHPGLHSVIIDPRDPRRVLVGVSCGGVYETTDGEATWHTRNKGLIAEFLPDPQADVGQDPHCLVACASKPDALWQQNHCGVFRSIDGAATWHKVSQEGGPAHFGFPIVVDPDKPNTAWVVPAISDEVRTTVDGALVVSRTEDGGQSWTTLNQGLPGAAYDIVFRHAFDLSGDQLAFGSTTGNLFHSADRGDTWSCLSHHLPPIHSVRFVD